MHILIVTSWYKDSLNPVAGSFVEEQARMLQKRGHTVAVLHAYINGTIKDTLRGIGEHYSEQNDDGIYTMRLSTNVYVPKIRRFSYNRLCRKSLKVVKSYIDRYGQIEVIHSHAMFMAGIVAQYISRCLQMPYFHTEHSSGFIFNPSQYTVNDIALAKGVIYNSEKCFFVSRFQMKKMIEVLHLKPNNLLVLHNVVPSIFFENYEINKFDNFTYIIIGNMIKLKNIDKVVGAWEKYVETYPNDKLIIVGDGPLWDSLSRQIATLNLTNSITMSHKRARKDIVLLLQKSHVLVSASDVETFGMTVAEALAVGNPIVTTDSGGIRDIIAGDTGIIVTEKKIDSLLEGMLQIRKNYYSYKACDLRKSARNKFSEDVIYNSLMECYNVR